MSNHARRAVGLAALAGAAALAAGCAGPGGDAAPTTGGATAGPGEEAGPASLTVEVHDTHPFDGDSFTQGLELEEGGTLLVGTGREGESRVYRRAPDGEELESAELDDDLFGEGVARVGDTVWQLTWREGVVVERDSETLNERARHEIPGEGWGLCFFPEDPLGEESGGVLYQSEGTGELIRRDPETFGELGRVNAPAGVDGLNELDCATGEGADPAGGDADSVVWANVFPTDEILGLDPETGEVLATVDAAELAARTPAAGEDPDHVLNGIAHVPGTGRFLLSGKKWPVLYEVEFVPAAERETASRPAGAGR